MRDRVLWAGCLAYALLLTWLGTIKYGAHRNLVDFGIFSQTVASGFGCFCNPLEGSHWAFHFSPILYIAAAAIAIVHAPIVLIALQAVACALCAPPVYAMVRARTERSTARLAALVVLLYPPLAGLAFADFHENGFAPAAVAWAIYCFDAGLLGWSLLSAAAALAVKEDQAVFLLVAGAGAAVAYRSDARRARCAIGVAVAALAVIAVFFFVIQPHARAAPGWQPQRFYAWSAGDVRALPSGLLARAGFLVLILAPLGFLPLRTPVALLAVAPLAEVLASRMSTTYTLGTHYAGAWAGYVFAAFAAGAVRVAPRRAALWWALGLCVLELIVANPLHPGLNLRGAHARDARLEASLRALPDGASVATQEEAYTHLALDDPFARLLPEDPAVETQACLALIDREFPDSPRLQEYGAALERLVRAGRYVSVARSGGIELYRRTTACR